MFYDDGQVGTKIHWGQIQRLFCCLPLFAPLSVFCNNSSAHIKKTHGVNSRQVNIIYKGNNPKWNRYLSLVWVNSAKTKLKENILSFFFLLDRTRRSRQTQVWEEKVSILEFKISSGLEITSFIHAFSTDASFTTMDTFTFELYFWTIPQITSIMVDIWDRMWPF